MLLKKFPFYKQLDIMGCGPTCLKMIAKFYGKKIKIHEIRDASNINRSGSTLLGISHAAEKIGFNTLAVNIDFETLKNKAPLPCIIHWNNNHFVVLYNINRKHVFVADPAIGLIKYSHAEFQKGWKEKNENGMALLIEMGLNFLEVETNTGEKKHSLRYFAEYVKPYSSYLFQILVAIGFVSVLQAISPFLIQALLISE